MVYQCGIIFGFLAIGEFVVWLTGIKLPSSIIGMLGRRYRQFLGEKSRVLLYPAGRGSYAAS